MLKTIFYGSLVFVGVVAALFSPLYGAIAVMESYLLNPIVYSPELASVRMQLVVTLAFLAGYFVHQPRGLPRVGSEGKLLWVLSLYAALALASTLWAARRPDVAWPFAIDLCKTVFVTVLLVRVPANQREVSMLFWALMIGASHAALMHTVGVNIGYLPEKLGHGEMGALPDFQGSIMVFVLPSMLLFALFGGNWKQRVFCWLSLPLVADSIVNTYQRTFFVAAAVQLSYLLLMVPRKALLKLVPVIAIGSLAAAALFMPQSYLDWIGTIQTYEEEGSAASRLTLGNASLRMLADYPLGVGYRNYQYVSPDYLPDDLLTTVETGERLRAAHHTFFAVACETGIPGLLLFLWAFVGTWLLLRRARKSVPDATADELGLAALGLEAGMVGWAVAGFFQTLHEDDPVFWTVALSVTLYRALRTRSAAGRLDPARRGDDRSPDLSLQGTTALS